MFFDLPLACGGMDFMTAMAMSIFVTSVFIWLSWAEWPEWPESMWSINTLVLLLPFGSGFFEASPLESFPPSFSSLPACPQISVGIEQARLDRCRRSDRLMGRSDILRQ